MSSSAQFIHLIIAVILLLVAASYSTQASRADESRRTRHGPSNMRDGFKGSSRRTSEDSGVIPKVMRAKSSLSRGSLTIMSTIWNYTKTRPINANFVASPFAMQAAILFRQIGVRPIRYNVKEKQFMEFLGYDDTMSSPDLNYAMRKYLDTLAQHPSFSFGLMYISNAVLPINAKFIQEAEQYYPVEYDSHRATEDNDALPGLIRRVNLWGADKTHNSIRQVLSGIDITNNTYDYLLALGHFQGEWRRQFNTERTMPGTFFNNGNPAAGRSVPFMSNFGPDYRYLDSRDVDIRDLPYKRKLKKRRRTAPLYPCDCEMVALPFADMNFHLMILMPAKVDGFAKLQAMPISMLIEFFQKGQAKSMDLRLPKFSTSSAFWISDIFQPHGMDSTFRKDVRNIFRVREATGPGIETKLAHGNILSLTERGVNVPGQSDYKKKYLKRPIDRNITVDRPFMFAIIYSDWNDIFVVTAGQITQLP